MALRQNTMPTMMDVVAQTSPNGNIMQLVELLNMTNEVLDDYVAYEANDGLGHRGAIRVGLPTPTWRRMYAGVQPSKSTTTVIRDTIGNLEAFAEVDKDVADLNGNAAAFRLQEDMAQIEGMNQKFTQTLFYGNESAEPAEFTGLAPRFNTLTAAANSDNVINAGGTGSNLSSIWLVVWGPAIHGLYPKGSKAGLSQTDMGEIVIENIDGLGGRMRAYRSHYKWYCGLHLRDWRYVVRIANIDHAALTSTNVTGPNLIDLMTQALELPPSLSLGRAVFYVPKKIRSFLRRQTTNRVVNSTLSVETVGGKPAVMFDTVPVRRVDALLLTESQVI